MVWDSENFVILGAVKCIFQHFLVAFSVCYCLRILWLWRKTKEDTFILPQNMEASATCPPHPQASAQCNQCFMSEENIVKKSFNVGRKYNANKSQFWQNVLSNLLLMLAETCCKKRIINIVKQIKSFFILVHNVWQPILKVSNNYLWYKNILLKNS